LWFRNDIVSFRNSSEEELVVDVAEHPTRSGRPRSPAADAAIRAATLDLLRSEGYANITMAGVAAEAGVSTATLYRRWHSKLDLVVDVLQALAEDWPIPDTGSLEGDCRSLLDTMRSRLSSTEPIMRGLVGEFSRNDELAGAIRRHLILPRRAAMLEVLDRAAARGELRPDVDHDLVCDVLAGALYYRVAVLGRPLTKAVADDLADLVLRAVGTEER
jgi:AcrR family transcriptional regulator